MGVFSTLNNPKDISLTPKYAEICGYTEKELSDYFSVHIKETAKAMKFSIKKLRDKMRDYYNGFTFDRECRTKLYNPFSTLVFFDEMDFANYWVESGRSQVIAEYMKNRDLTVEEFRDFPIPKDFARSPGEMDTTPPHGFFYYFGYLTLRKGTSDDLSLDYPNTEVLNSMSELLSKNILTDNAHHFQNNLKAAIVTNNADDLVEVINNLLSCIPYEDFTSAAKQKIKLSKSNLSVQEWLYRSVIIAFMRGCGIVTFAEVQSNVGRSDIVLTHKGHIWVIEIKVAFDGQSPERKAKEAIKQIKDNNYAKSYHNPFCLGVAIDDAKRQITEWKVEIE
jgi:uncharacterized protein YqkB